MSDKPLPRTFQVKPVGLVAGPIVALVVYALLPGAQVDPGTGAIIAGMSEGGRATAAVALLMAIWWLTEALPISATALVPLALFPLLGVSSMHQAAAPYADKLIFLFMGGFMIGIAMERCKLHARFALAVVRLIGSEPKRLIGGFMIASATLSMWISNTATVVMMLPIGLSIIALVQRQLVETVRISVHEMEAADAQTSARKSARTFALALLLGIAYAASIGGVGSLIGTPPNALLAAYVERNIPGMHITFAQWLAFGIPVVLVMLPITWWLLTRVLFSIPFSEIPGGRDVVKTEQEKLGPMKFSEWAVLIVFLCTATLWITREWLVSIGTDYDITLLKALDDSGIAMMAAVALFVLPARDGKGTRLLDWGYAEARLPWGVLILFGGGLSMADAMTRNGVALFIGQQFSGLSGIETIFVVILITATVVFLTEMTSNTATTSALLPILGGVAAGLAIHPYLLIVPAALGASMAFMMPVATPPNAIVFASGHVTIPQMARAGLWLNFLAIALITIVSYFFLGTLLGVDLTHLPPKP